ncbi:D-alanyl-D-alanine carboxypeptidase [Stackebrandtia albiflava]|uniref:D-alanyl-D-alanine carboxypeptidase n=1 Tax=Stackebrandtia albiflava TaxID=406432 RepID=A0A562UYP1_9ACTN|nr:serine hydrolase domain-containing protein [Stackebrandtia albiflava]TWJ10732.1 D-alanyl-D-alanine carboxypeptidase [Stackebrandtia albiflava]
MTENNTSTASSSTGTDRAVLQEIVDGLVEGGITGVRLRFRDAHGEWTGAAGTGELDGTEAPPADGHYRIGSNTKTFTAVVVLRLVAEGRIDLDTAVAEYLPEIGIDPRITVRMLLQHTTGVFNHTGEVYEDGTVVTGIPFQGREWVEGRFKSYRPGELVAFSLARPSRFEPGTDWSYANTNYVLARLVVEKVTGRGLAEELDRLIVGPLGLTGTSLPDGTTELPTPHAHAYYRYDHDGEERIADVTAQDPSWVSTGGDMVSTPRDLQVFITALVGGRLLPASLLAEMFTVHEKVPYGLGVFVHEVPGGGTVITHNGGIAGHAALMYASADGSRVLTAGLNYVDDKDLSMSGPFQAVNQRIVQEVFGVGPAE